MNTSNLSLNLNPGVTLLKVAMTATLSIAFCGTTMAGNEAGVAVKIEVAPNRCLNISGQANGEPVGFELLGKKYKEREGYRLDSDEPGTGRLTEAQFQVVVQPSADKNAIVTICMDKTFNETPQIVVNGQVQGSLIAFGKPICI